MSETTEPAGGQSPAAQPIAGSPNKGVTAPTDDGIDTPPKENIEPAAGESLIGSTREPVEYTDFTVPEGMEADKDAIAAFKPVAQELGLSQEGAQRLVSMYADRVKAFQEQIAAQHAAAQAEAQKQVKEWLGEIQADPDLPKDKAVLQYTIARAMQKFCKGNDEFKSLKQAMELSGLGNHPAFVRFFYRVGRASSEEALAVGGQTAPQTTKTVFERLIPEPTPRFGN